MEDLKGLHSCRRLSKVINYAIVIDSPRVGVRGIPFEWNLWHLRGKLSSWSRDLQRSISGWGGVTGLRRLGLRRHAILTGLSRQVYIGRIHVKDFVGPISKSSGCGRWSRRIGFRSGN